MHNNYVKNIALPFIPLKLKQAILNFLIKHPVCGEFELLTFLNSQGYSEFSTSFDPLTLFRSHFLLFHILFRLQDEWLTDEIAILNINSTKISLKPLLKQPKRLKSPGVVSAIVQDAKLKAYYLDYSEFINTQEEDVIKLLSQFWLKYAQIPADNDLQTALSTLKINKNIQNLCLADIKKAYKEASLIHHPDKGGEASQFLKITDAYQLLKLAIQV